MTKIKRRLTSLEIHTRTGKSLRKSTSNIHKGRKRVRNLTDDRVLAINAINVLLLHSISETRGNFSFQKYKEELMSQKIPKSAAEGVVDLHFFVLLINLSWKESSDVIFFAKNLALNPVLASSGSLLNVSDVDSCSNIAQTPASFSLLFVNICVASVSGFETH